MKTDREFTRALALEISELTNVEPEKIMSRSRVAHVADARAMLQHRLRIVHKWTFKRISLVFGMTHSTVIHNVNKAQEYGLGGIASN